MNIFYIPNPTQYLNVITTFLTINKQQIRSLLRDLKIKCDRLCFLLMIITLCVFKK